MNVAGRANLQRLPGYAIVQAYRELRHTMDAALRDMALTTPQFGALACIGETGGLSGAEMARMHRLTPQTMHTILQNLEVAGLIMREADPHHGTLLRVELTPEGRERLAEAMQRVEGVQERMLRALEPDEAELLTQLLDKCAQSLHVDGACPENRGAGGSPCIE